MDDMEIDQIVDVPDTPDRSTTRHSGQKYVGDADVYVNERRERVFPAAENGKNGRLAFSPLKSSTNGEVSSLKKSCPPQNDPIFRRSRTGKFLGHELTHSSGSGKMEKGKDICTKVPSKLSSRGREGVAVFDLTEENGEPRKIKTVSRHRMKDSATENKKELKVTMGNSPIPCIPDSSNTSTNAFTEKCKIDCKALPCTNVSVDRGKSIDLSNDSQERVEKQKSLPHHLLNTSRFRGSKRLVRNGCISPHNIAARAKQSSEQNTQRTNHFEFSHAKDALSPTCNNDIIAEEKSGSRVKGKELYIHPSSAHVTGSIHGANSYPFVNNEEADGMGSVIRNSLGSSCGWRTTRNHRSIDQPLHDLTGHLSRRGSESESFISSQYGNREDRRNTGRSQSSMDGRYPLRNDAPHATSISIPDAEQFTRPCPTADKLTKRQRKDGSTSRNPNSEIMILDLLGESSNSSSSRSPVLDSEDIELLPDSDNVNNNDSDARARQVEADEILARELQEQLYHEDSVNGTDQIDEHLAWELQHEEDLGHTSIESHHTSHPRWLSRAPSNRSIRTRSHQSPTNRRRAVPHVPLSNRVSQLRSRIANRSSMPAISTRGGRFRFPMDMDFDMRLDILEALEDAFGDFNDMGVADDIFQAHRDFNENDYEMLLALDENNHQHAGASATQINSLPQSTIQTDNFQEACAICLEIPVMGDTIRHLPCLHKFHKDCIDPWLHRRTSCPVCKSSIT